MAVASLGRQDLRALIDAVHMNRMLWGALGADCARSDNSLPAELRARIIALSRWVSEYSGKVMREKESVEPLIDVNRIIMDGLSGRSNAA
jgi:flagellar protein FlaF